MTFNPLGLLFQIQMLFSVNSLFYKKRMCFKITLHILKYLLFPKQFAHFTMQILLVEIVLFKIGCTVASIETYFFVFNFIIRFYFF